MINLQRFRASFPAKVSLRWRAELRTQTCHPGSCRGTIRVDVKGAGQATWKSTSRTVPCSLSPGGEVRNPRRVKTKSTPSCKVH